MRSSNYTLIKTLLLIVLCVFVEPALADQARLRLAVVELDDWNPPSEVADRGTEQLINVPGVPSVTIRKVTRMTPFGKCLSDYLDSDEARISNVTYFSGWPQREQLAQYDLVVSGTLELDRVHYFMTTYGLGMAGTVVTALTGVPARYRTRDVSMLLFAVRPAAPRQHLASQQVTFSEGPKAKFADGAVYKLNDHEMFDACPASALAEPFRQFAESLLQLEVRP